MQIHLLVEAISQSISVETRIVLKRRKRGLISLWRRTKQPMTSIKKIEQSSSIGLQPMTESRSRQNRILLTWIMLWNFTIQCVINIWMWVNYNFLTSISQVLHNSKVSTLGHALMNLYFCFIYQITINKACTAEQWSVNLHIQKLACE